MKNRIFSVKAIAVLLLCAVITCTLPVFVSAGEFTSTVNLLDVRKNTRGDGFNWDVKYWELWNEPDGVNNMWCLPEGDGTRGTPEFAKRDKIRRDLFCKFFVTCLKRLKKEFPECKFGGPAMCSASGRSLEWFKSILAACKEAGVAPDFMSWHYYGYSVEKIIADAENMRKLCDSYGFKDCELIINEWHYLGSYSWGGLRNNDPKVLKAVWEGPASHNGIDSSCFTLATMAKMQTSEYDQSYFYGCRHSGAWGYMDEHRRKYKVWYALKLFGSIMKECPVMCASAGDKTVTTLATKGVDGKSGWLLVVDYCGKEDSLVFDVKGVRGVKSATLLDHERNNENVNVDFADGRLILKKKLPGSAAFLVKFEL